MKKERLIFAICFAMLVASVAHIIHQNQIISMQQEIITKQNESISNCVVELAVQNEYIKKLESINNELKLDTDRISAELKAVSEWLGKDE